MNKNEKRIGLFLKNISQFLVLSDANSDAFALFLHISMPNPLKKRSDKHQFFIRSLDCCFLKGNVYKAFMQIILYRLNKT